MCVCLKHAKMLLSNILNMYQKVEQHAQMYDAQ